MFRWKHLRDRQNCRMGNGSSYSVCDLGLNELFLIKQVRYDVKKEFGFRGEVTNHGEN